MNVLQRWFVRLVSRRAGPHLRAYGLLRTVKHHPALVCEPGAERERRERELVHERKAEARRALETLGTAEPVFLDAPDWQVAAEPHLKDALRRNLDAVRPEVVYVPFFLDAHPDHRATAELLLAAARPDDRFECRGYEVWTPLYPNCLVDIDETVEVKRRALEQYRSQLADNDYVHAALGLNAYRSMLLSRSAPGFAEAFFAAPLAEYRRLHDAWRQPS